MAAPPATAMSGGPMPGMVPVRLRTPSGKTAVFYASTAGAPGPQAGSMAPPPVDVNPSVSMVASSDKLPTVSREALEEERPPTAEWANVSSGEATPNHESERLSEELHAAKESEDDLTVQMRSDEVMHETHQGDIGSSEAESFVVGDVVYRNGELASVVHVDTTLDPPSYVIRIARGGNEISCEGQHLSLAFSRSSETSPCTTVPDSDELNHASTEVAQTTFADIVQMQHANLSQAPLTEQLQQQQQLQMQYLQMQQMQHLQQMNMQPDPMQQQLQHMQQLWTEQASIAPSNAFEPTSEQMQQMYEASAAQPGMYYNSQQIAGFSGGNFDSPYTLASQQQSSEQFEHKPYASTDISSDGGSHENHALKAVAEALDRAEINMLTGGRRRCSSPPGMNLGGDMDPGDFPMRPTDGSRVGGSTNFALQAAADMLTGNKRQGSNPPGLNLGADFDSLHFPAHHADSTRTGNSTNFALQAAADALGKMDNGSTLAGRLGSGKSHGNTQQPCEDFRVAKNPFQVEQGFPSMTSRSENIANQQMSMFSHAMHVGAREDNKTQLESLLSSELVKTQVAQPPLDLESQQIRSIASQDQSSTVDIANSFINSAMMPQASVANTIPAFGDDDDEELELMARREMEEDEHVSFPTHLPPKPPNIENMQSVTQASTVAPNSRCAPPTHSTLPIAPRAAMPSQPPPQLPRRSITPTASAPAPQPCRVPLPTNTRSRSKDRFSERDALVDFILSDAPSKRSITPFSSKRSTTPLGSKRSTTPLGSRTNGGRSTPRLPDGRSGTPRASDGRSTQRMYDGTSTPTGARSSSRGPGARSKSPQLFFSEEHHVKNSPRRPWTGKAAPHMLDFVQFDGLFEASSKPRGKPIANLDDSSPGSSVSSLPHLSDKRSGQQKKNPITNQVPKSARNWRENAISIYA